LFFLFIQLLIAVILLQVSALFTKRIEIPKLDVKVAKSLVPVVGVNIIGLVFNTLCLRDVEASFFQVRTGVYLPRVDALSESFASHRLPGDWCCR
jgi:GDP-fucose transporter C1